MTAAPREIVNQWKEQMVKGYLKMAVLFVLMRKPMHGYEIIKSINEWTFGIMTPTAGSIYPTLRDLEKRELIEGWWIPEKRRKIYRITERGRRVFKEAIEKHFEFASTLRKWLLREMARLGIIEDLDIPSVMGSALKLLLLRGDASVEARIEALKRLRLNIQNAIEVLSRIVKQIKIREEKLKQEMRLKESSNRGMEDTSR